MSAGVQPNASVGEQFKKNRAGRIRLTYNYSFSDSDHFYFHERRQHTVERAARATSLVNEHLLVLEVDVTNSLSTVLELPFVYVRQTRSGPGSVAVNGAMIGSGFSDAKIGVRYWLYEVEDGLRFYGLGGLRIPSGGSDEKFTSQANRRVDKDVAVQPGTGNFAAYLELGGTYSDSESILGYFASARYFFTPETETKARNFRNQLSGRGVKRNSDADSFLWKVGTSIAIGRAIRESIQEEPIEKLDGLALLLAVSGAYVPYDDIIGADRGFRRGALLVFIEPGIIYSFSEVVTVNMSVPITAYRYVNKNGGNVPEILFQAGVTFTFN